MLTIPDIPNIELPAQFLAAREELLLKQDALEINFKEPAKTPDKGV